jgi:hypothetical protein
MTDALPIEVRKIAYRQSAKDGLVITFSVHPNDMPAALAAAPIGARFMAALVEINDDETPKEQPSPSRDSNSTAAGVKQYSLPQRVAMTCNEPAFCKFVTTEIAGFSERDTVMTPDEAAVYVRAHCLVTSRSEILPGTEAAKRWDELSGKYEGWKRGME